MTNTPRIQKLMKHSCTLYAEKCKRVCVLRSTFWQRSTRAADLELAPSSLRRAELLMRVFERKPKLYDLVVNVPPGTSKSRIFTIMAPVWGWINDDTLKFINGSYAIDLSLEHADASRDIIKSRRFQLYFPLVQIRQDKDVKGNYHTRRRGSGYVCRRHVTGMHAHHHHRRPQSQEGGFGKNQAANHWMERR